jgi:hypothetical protein
MQYEIEQIEQCSVGNKQGCNGYLPAWMGSVRPDILAAAAAAAAAVSSWS